MRFTRPACHTDGATHPEATFDASVASLAATYGLHVEDGTHKDVSGGLHDAGDFGKYVGVAQLFSLSLTHCL